MFAVVCSPSCRVVVFCDSIDQRFAAGAACRPPDVCAGGTLCVVLIQFPEQDKNKQDKNKKKFINIPHSIVWQFKRGNKMHE